MGKQKAQQNVYNQQAAAYEATQPPPATPAAPAEPAPTDPTTTELIRLATLHESGALNDEEFAAAKAKVLM